MREHTNDVVRLADLTVSEEVIRRMTFVNCRIIGPAVLLPLHDVSFLHCSWDGTFDALFWEVAAGRQLVIGAVGVEECTFSGCTFSSVGVAGDAAFGELLRGGFAG